MPHWRAYFKLLSNFLVVLSCSYALKKVFHMRTYKGLRKEKYTDDVDMISLLYQFFDGIDININ